jgi:hypothetical protein
LNIQRGIAEAVAVLPVLALMSKAYLLIFTALRALTLVQPGADAVSARVQNRTFTESHLPASH